MPQEFRKMTQELRNAIVAIVLNEAFGYSDGYIACWFAGKFDKAHPEPNHEDFAAMDTAQQIVGRIEARCSKIEG